MTSPNDFQGSPETLCEICVIFRHGDRAPLYVWSSDPNKSLWPNGPGSLTNKGKQQGYLVGQLLRDMYPGLLQDKYLKDEIYIHSTYTDRTMMTALCCLAGLYPPKHDDVWLANMPWQPIPIDASSDETDPFNLRFDQDDFLTLMESVDTSTCDEYRVLAEHMNVLKAIYDKSKSDGGDGSLYTLGCIIDGYLSKAKEGLLGYMPPEIDLDLSAASTILSAIYSLFMQNKTLRSSPVHLMKDMLLKVEAKIAGKVEKQKVVVYSTHDITLSIAISFLDIPKIRASYGATMVFELHKHPENEEYFMKIMFKDNIESPEGPKTLSMNGFKMIPFSEFQKMIQGLKG